jgi:hypothetical protein
VERVAAAAGKMTADLDLLHAGLSGEPPSIVQAVMASGITTGVVLM